MGGFISGETPWRRSRRVISAPAPAAGTDWSFTVPAGLVWRVIAVHASLVTSATVATRASYLTFTDGDTRYLAIPPIATQAASLTYYMSWAEHVSAYFTSPCLLMALPDLILEPGWTIAPITAAIQAADQWSAPQLYVIETTVKGGPVDMGELPDVYVEVVSSPAA